MPQQADAAARPSHKSVHGAKALHRVVTGAGPPSRAGYGGYALFASHVAVGTVSL